MLDQCHSKLNTLVPSEISMVSFRGSCIRNTVKIPEGGGEGQRRGVQREASAKPSSHILDPLSSEKVFFFFA